MSAHDTLQIFDIDSPLSIRSNRHSNHPPIPWKKAHNRSTFLLSLRISFTLSLCTKDIPVFFFSRILHTSVASKREFEALSISRFVRQAWRTLDERTMYVCIVFSSASSERGNQFLPLFGIIVSVCFFRAHFYIQYTPKRIQKLWIANSRTWPVLEIPLCGLSGRRPFDLWL